MTDETEERDDGAAAGPLVDVFGRVFRLKGDMRQRDVAAWNRAYAGYDFGPRVARADERQAALQAAIEANWIESPPVLYEQVIDMTNGAVSKRHVFDGVPVDALTAAEVNYYGLLCSREFDRLMAVPKASSST